MGEDVRFPPQHLNEGVMMEHGSCRMYSSPDASTTTKLIRGENVNSAVPTK